MAFSYLDFSAEARFHAHLTTARELCALGDLTKQSLFALVQSIRSCITDRDYQRYRKIGQTKECIEAMPNVRKTSSPTLAWKQ